MRIEQEEKFTFDDVLIKPGMSLESRKSADLSQYLWQTRIDHPIIPANMDTIAGEKLCYRALTKNGIAVLHRFMPGQSRLDFHLNAIESIGYVNPPFISVGVTDEEIEIISVLHGAGVRNFCIDIAHGHSIKVAEVIEFIRNLDAPKKDRSIIIAGNVATIEGYNFLVDAGADIVKVGIGPGSHCTTRIVTGCGYPQLSAIIDIAKERDAAKNEGKKHIFIIADGGIKNSGDIVKALAAGADFIMSGSLFAGCEETPGDVFQWKDGSKYKMYRGMASKDAQIGWKNEGEIVPEGESSIVPYAGTFGEKLRLLLGGISSGMSYVGAKNLEELREKAVFIKVTSNVTKENTPHGKT